DRSSGRPRSTPMRNATDGRSPNWSRWAGESKRYGSANCAGSRRRRVMPSSSRWRNAFGRGIRMAKQGMLELGETGRVAEEAADGSPLWWKIQALVNDSDQLLVKKLSRN